MNEVFDPNEARRKVAAALAHGSRELLESELREFIGDPNMPSIEKEAARAQLNLISEEKSPGSTKRIFSGGIWREMRPEPSATVQATRTEIRSKLEALPEYAPRREREALHKQLSATYQR